MNIHETSHLARRRLHKERLEEQLEDVLEPENVSFVFGRTMHTPLGGGTEERDIRIMKDIQGKTARARRKTVQVRHEPHEASAHLIRLQGVAAKPIEEVREPFHRSMHQWETPLLDGVDIDAIAARAGDLWVDQIDPDYIAIQFTPGDPEEAFRESRRGLWTRIRRPFIRWEPSRQPEKQSSLSAVEILIPPDPIIAVPVAEKREYLMHPSLFHGDWWKKFRERFALVRERGQETVQDVEEAWEVPYVQSTVRPGRVIIAFFGLLCLVALPAGAVSWSRSITRSFETTKTAAVELMKDAPMELTELSFWSDKIAKFEGMAKELERAHGIAFSLAQLMPSTRATAKTTQALLVAAQEGAEAARLVSLGVARLSDTDVQTPDERLVRFKQYLEEADPHLDRLFASARDIDVDALPQEIRTRVIEAQTALFDLEPVLGSANQLASLLLEMVGHDQSRTYLVLFQNTGELRPSGGFMGSYAEVTLDRGRIRKLHVPGGGPYDLRSQLRARWRPPEPLTLVGSRWEFQDANWFPDFAQTAGTIRTFWEKAGQPTIDGIIAVNSSILPKLLTLTGPIDMPAYGKHITAENVIFETQKAVELEYDREANTPKAFVGDLNKEVIARLQSLDTARWTEVAAMLVTALETKEMQLWFARSEAQDIAKEFGWTGEWTAPGAFASLGVIGANIAGQKSDAAIKEDVHQLITIDDQGGVSERVLLAREHRGTAGQLFQGANNVQYLRLYVPQGTQFTNAEGFSTPEASLFEMPTEKEEVFFGMSTSTHTTFTNGESIDMTEEGERLVAGGWIQLQPGMSRETAFSYRLSRSTQDMAMALLDGVGDHSVTDAYVARLQSQSGAPRSHHIRLAFPSGWRVIQMSSGMKEVRPGIIEWERSVLDRDQTLAVLFSRYASPNSEKAHD